MSSKLVRILSIRRLGTSFRRILPLLASSHIPFGEKLLFLIPVIAYWLLPDVLPFMPLDDIAVSLLMLNWFVDRAERKYNV